MDRILFIKTSSLGDVIHHMPAVTDARRSRQNAHLAWVVEEAFAPLVRLHPAVDEVIAVAQRRWRKAALAPRTWREMAAFIGALRRHEYDAVIDSQGLFFKSALLARVARGERHGYDAASIRERAASSLYNVRHRIGRALHAVARNRLLTGAALDYAPDAAIDFGLERHKLANPQFPYGVLLHGTARAHKEWPLAAWVALGRALAERRHRLILPWGSTAEWQRSGQIAEAASSTVPQRQELDTIARMIAGASFVIGVDTGLLHLAAALGVPLVAIFVGSEPGLTGPVGRGPIGVVGGKGLVPSVADVLTALDQIGLR
jgi:lipopolysaccharide heptosyltransferase I